jgi:hypothetical protein
MNLLDLLNNPPKLHRDGSGNPVSWKLNDQVLSFIDESVNENSKTLETGAGVSTILFALKGTYHTCITPDAQLIERVKDYCHEQDISTEKIHFSIGRSEDILPHLKTDDLDLVLIDGRHAFPSPFIDWYYSSTKLKKNGIVIIDDILIWTGKVIKDFLVLESAWTLKEDFLDACAFIKKEEDTHQKFWAEQPYLVKQSNYALRHWAYRVNKGLRYLLRGNFGALKRELTLAD